MKIRHPAIIKWIGLLGAIIIRIWTSTLSFRYRSLGENAFPDRPRWPISLRFLAREYHGPLRHLRAP